MFCIMSQNYNAADTNPITHQDVYFSYLPMAHVMEQSMLCHSALTGMQYGFYSGNVSTMFQTDIPLLKPTIFVSVPRLFKRLYD